DRSGVDQHQVGAPQHDGLVQPGRIVVEESEGPAHAPLDGIGQVVVACEAVDQDLVRGIWLEIHRSKRITRPRMGLPGGERYNSGPMATTTPARRRADNDLSAPRHQALGSLL